MTADFAPYLPRLIDEWVRDVPRAAWRVIDGTLVFVDISGFTAMSERLARRGRVGAEEVTDVIGASFSKLLASAYDESAQLLKFGGDALLLLFSGSDHASRACRSAFRMRRDLRSFGRFRTSAGFVPLKMSVGIHSGNIMFVLAGGSHRELMVIGPAVTDVVKMESAAQGGQILLSAAIAGAIPQYCLGPACGDGWLLKRPPATAAAIPASVLGRRRNDVANFLPVAIREHIAIGVAESEHRHVTVAFLHFDGTDELLRTAGPDAVAAQLDALVRAAQAACEEYAICFLGTDLDRDGGKIILTAGAPKSAENGEERMLRALRSIVERSDLLPLRVGVNCGHVFAGDIGPPFRRTYTVMGDAVNLAARLMAKAQPGQVLATSAVLDRSRTVFATTALAPFTVKGKTRPVAAWNVGLVQGIRVVDHTDDQPIVGREAEMAALLALLEDAQQDGPRLAEITGDAGIGKSRLVEEFVARAGKVRCYKATGEPYESSTAYSPFRRLVRAMMRTDATGDDLARELRHRVATSAPQLLPWLPLIAVVIEAPVASTPEVDRLSPAFRRERLHRVVTELIVHLERGPALFVFEDAHLFDEASSELLRFLVANVKDRPWLICVTTRFGGGASYGADQASTLRLCLEPLTASASRSLAATMSARRPLTPAEAAALVERAGGNPLFLRELVASQADRSAPLPDSLEELIVSRLDSLPPAHRRLLRYAAVVGVSFHPQLLADVVDLPTPDADPRVWRALDEFLIETEGGWRRFRHALLQEIAYESLPFRRRRELHRRIGDHLERTAGDDPKMRAELLSLHFFRAREFAKAYRFSLVAGRRAKDKFANVEAETFFRRAIQAGRELADVSPRDLAEVYEALGDVEELSGSYVDASAAFAAARAALVRSEEAVPRLCWKEGVIRERLGKYAQAIRWYNRGSRSAVGGTSSLQLRLAYAGVRFRQGRYAECARVCRQIVPDAVAAGDKPRLAHAYYLLSHACTLIGNADGDRFRGLALPIYEELDDWVGQANVLNNLGVAAYFEGQWDDALAYYQRSREARERAGDVVGAATAANNIGEILLDRGKLDEASALFREALGVWRGARYAVGIALAQNNLGRAAARAGRFDEGSALLNEALAGFRAIGAASFVLDVEAHLAECQLLAGDYNMALRLTSDSMRRAELEGMVALKAKMRRIRGYALLRAGRFGDARASFMEALKNADAANADYERALTRQALASVALAVGEDPAPFLADAVATFERLGIASMPLMTPAPSSSSDRAIETTSMGPT